MASINFAALMGVIKGDVRHNTTQNSQVANFTLVTKAKAHPNAPFNTCPFERIAESTFLSLKVSITCAI